MTPLRSDLVSCPIGFAAGTLGLQRREEALHRSDRLMLHTMPLSAISRWNCSLVYWLP